MGLEFLGSQLLPVLLAGREVAHPVLTEVPSMPTQANVHDCTRLPKFCQLEGTPYSVSQPSNTSTPVPSVLTPPASTPLTNPRVAFSVPLRVPQPSQQGLCTCCFHWPEGSFLALYLCSLFSLSGTHLNVTLSEGSQMTLQPMIWLVIFIAFISVQKSYVFA